MFKLRLAAAAKKCFKELTGEEVLNHKKIKIMEEIGEEIKDQLKISTMTMEEPKYNQLLIETLSKLEEMKMKKEQQTDIIFSIPFYSLSLKRLSISFSVLMFPQFLTSNSPSHNQQHSCLNTYLLLT